jgi:NADH:ubiquinone oxidoreductase subunit 2 (subunit N)
MVLAWILSAATYMPVVLAMYFKPSHRGKTARISYPILFVVASCAILTLYWGLLPSTLVRIAAESARALIY